MISRCFDPRVVMDILRIGRESRKVGLKPRDGVRKDKYHMESVDEFFSSDDDEAVLKYRREKAPENSIARKIEFNDSETDKFDLSPVGAFDTPKPASTYYDDFYDNYDPEIPPESPKKTPMKPSSSIQLFVPEDADPDDEPAQDPPGDIPDDVVEVAGPDDAGAAPDDVLEGDEAEMSARQISSFTKSLALGKPTRRRKKPQSPQEIRTVIPPSQLPSPPPDGLRRSKRTRLQPLKYWKNERVVYEQEPLPDPDTTLTSEFNRFPLREIKEIIQTSTPEKPKPDRRMRKVKPKRAAVKRNIKKTELGEYDYESDPEVEGSEWFKEKELTLPVFENDRDETSLDKTIAYTSDFNKILEDPPRNSDSIDNYKIAQIFDERPLTAGALMEFPDQGFKASKTSGNCVYMFHVIKGMFEVVVSNHTFVVTRGCSFQVPFRNTYSITNIGNGSGKLFCVQVRRDESWDESVE